MRQDSESARENIMSLEERVAQYKSDPEKLQGVAEFVDKLILHAEQTAEVRIAEQNKPKNVAPVEQVTTNFKRRFGRARGYMVRLFEALCNTCTNSGVAAPARAASRSAPANR